MRAASIPLLTAILIFTGCSKEEKNEATRLVQVLTEKQADYSKATAIEKELVDNAKAWCGGIAANGSGKGPELDQNATVAKELAKSAVAASTELSRVRQAITDQPLKREYLQGVRSELVTELTRRQRRLQDIRLLLDQSAPQFLDYRKIKAYAGDSYPGQISTLNEMLQAYKPPPDTVGDTIASLKSKYGL